MHKVASELAEKGAQVKLDGPLCLSTMIMSEKGLNLTAYEIIHTVQLRHLDPPRGCRRVRPCGSPLPFIQERATPTP